MARGKKHTLEQIVGLLGMRGSDIEQSRWSTFCGKLKSA